MQHEPDCGGIVEHLQAPRSRFHLSVCSPVSSTVQQYCGWSSRGQVV